MDTSDTHTQFLVDMIKAQHSQIQYLLDTIEKTSKPKDGKPDKYMLDMIEKTSKPKDGTPDKERLSVHTYYIPVLDMLLRKHHPDLLQHATFRFRNYIPGKETIDMTINSLGMHDIQIQVLENNGKFRDMVVMQDPSGLVPAQYINDKFTYDAIHIAVARNIFEKGVPISHDWCSSTWTISKADRLNRAIFFGQSTGTTVIVAMCHVPRAAYSLSDGVKVAIIPYYMGVEHKAQGIMSYVVYTRNEYDALKVPK